MASDWPDDRFLTWLEERDHEFQPRPAAEEHVQGENGKYWAKDVAVMTGSALCSEFAELLSLLAVCPRTCARVSRLLHERGEELDEQLRRKLRLYYQEFQFNYAVLWLRLLDFLTPPQREELEQLNTEVQRTWPRPALTANIMFGGLVLCNPITHQPSCTFEKRCFDLTFYQGLPSGVNVRIITREDLFMRLCRGLTLRTTSAATPASPSSSPATSAASTTTATALSASDEGAADEEQCYGTPPSSSSPHVTQPATRCSDAASSGPSCWKPYWLQLLGGAAGAGWQVQPQHIGMKCSEATDLMTPLLMSREEA